VPSIPEMKGINKVKPNLKFKPKFYFGNIETYGGKLEKYYESND
jgi:hypothetical protein